MSAVDWHNSPYDVYIGRHVPDGPPDVPPEACIYGNPFVLNDVNDAEERAHIIAAYEKWLLSPEQSSLVAMAKTKLPGKVLGCWCKPRDCHGDVLLWVVNAEADDIEKEAAAAWGGLSIRLLYLADVLGRRMNYQTHGKRFGRVRR